MVRTCYPERSLRDKFPKNPGAMLSKEDVNIAGTTSKELDNSRCGAHDSISSRLHVERDFLFLNNPMY
jgi:hypothetical protein